MYGSVGEPPDRQERPADRERVDDDVHTGAVGQAGVDHRRRLVDATADLAHDLVDDAAQVVLVDELARRCSSILPRALDVDLVGPFTMTSVMPGSRSKRSIGP